MQDELDGGGGGVRTSGAQGLDHRHQAPRLLSTALNTDIVRLVMILKL